MATISPVLLDWLREKGRMDIASGENIHLEEPRTLIILGGRRVKQSIVYVLLQTWG